MTDRFLTLTVLLNEGMREDDAQDIIDAIKMVRGVKAVEGNVVDIEQWAAITTARIELGRKLIDVLCRKNQS